MDISFFKNVFGDKYEGNNTVDVDIVLKCIQTGGRHGMIQQQINHIRALSDQAQMNYFKRQLPVIMWQGTFTEKCDAGLVSLSSLVCIDIDHKTIDELRMLWNSLTKEPWVYAIFRSPNGDGLKVLVKTDNTTPTLYKNCYRQVEELFHQRYNIEPDSNCEPLSQGCFLSYDPNIYVNAQPGVFKFVYDPMFDPIHQPVRITQSLVKNKNDDFIDKIKKMSMCRTEATDESIIAYLDQKYHKFPDNYIDGHRTRSIFLQAKELCECGIDESSAIEYLKENFLPTGYDKEKLVHETKRAYEKYQDSFGSRRDSYNKRS